MNNNKQEKTFRSRRKRVRMDRDKSFNLRQMEFFARSKLCHFRTFYIILREKEFKILIRTHSHMLSFSVKLELRLPKNEMKQQTSIFSSSSSLFVVVVKVLFWLDSTLKQGARLFVIYPSIFSWMEKGFLFTIHNLAALGS